MEGGNKMNLKVGDKVHVPKQLMEKYSVGKNGDDFIVDRIVDCAPGEGCRGIGCPGMVYAKNGDGGCFGYGQPIVYILEKLNTNVWKGGKR